MARPKMTPEQKEQAALMRRKQRQEQATQQDEDCKRWPGAWLDGHQEDTGTFGQIVIDPGNEWITIRIRKRGKWSRESGTCSEVEHFELNPTLQQVLGLVRALSIRYNAIVEQMNRDALEIVIPQLPTIPQAEDIDRASPPQ